jgi:hypothetical protein
MQQGNKRSLRGEVSAVWLTEQIYQHSTNVLMLKQIFYSVMVNTGVRPNIIKKNALKIKEKSIIQKLPIW